MKNKYSITTLLFIISSFPLNAVVVATLDFSQPIWTIDLSQTGGFNESSFAGGTLTADKRGPTGGVQITATLNSSISTLGFENISLAFTGSSVGNLEFDAMGGGAVSADDGLHIIGGGINIDTNGINNTAAETAFSNTSIFPNGDFSSDFVFDPSVDNSSISNLVFTLRVNAGGEELSISNVQIIGDMVPEPSTTALFGLGGLALLLRRKQ